MLIFDLCIKKTKIIGSYHTFQYSREIKATTSLTYNVSRTKKPIKLHKEIWLDLKKISGPYHLLQQHLSRVLDRPGTHLQAIYAKGYTWHKHIFETLWLNIWSHIIIINI